MITVYEIKSNGFIGTSKQINPREGVSSNWTYTPPPAEGPHKWENSQWVYCEQEHEVLTCGLDIEKLSSDLRVKRNTLLSECDWTQVADAPVDKEAWATFRQSLRDITEQSDFPINVEWPIAPSN